MRAQHRTVADYAAWLFRGFPAECGTDAEVIPHPTVDFASPRPMEAAEAIVRIANARMAGAIRLVSIERGHDPQIFTAVPFGGGGASGSW